MWKRFLSLLLLIITLAVFSQPVNATLTNGTKKIHGTAEYWSAYVTSASNDTTDPATGPVIDNRDGSIKNIHAMIIVTNKTGTSPTAKLQIRGSADGTNWFTIQSADATPVAIETSALDISSADSTTVVGQVNTCEELRCDGGFPAFIRLEVDLGGTSPGWTGVLSLKAER